MVTETAEQILDGIQIELNVMGLTPVFGEAADIINAGISFARGDHAGAVPFLVAALPLEGWSATTGKVVRRANKATNSTARASSRSGAKIKEIAKTKKRNQLKKNHKSGKRREKEVEKELADEGRVVIGTQVSAKTPLSRRVIDILIKNGKTGKIRAIEVKAGGAKRSTKQISKDDAMVKHGSELIGKNAPKGDEFKGTIKIPTEVRK
ncbi:hypothetical protein ACK1U3_19270 [Pseudomonas promysalinigenes]|uniref:hypothetical protein n=1 Tax=Pseudomonas promysalinigenes TaxID=485898 RepID=UPI00391714B8